MLNFYSPSFTTRSASVIFYRQRAALDAGAPFFTYADDPLWLLYEGNADKTKKTAINGRKSGAGTKASAVWSVCRGR